MRRTTRTSSEKPSPRTRASVRGSSSGSTSIAEEPPARQDVRQDLLSVSAVAQGRIHADVSGPEIQDFQDLPHADGPMRARGRVASRADLFKLPRAWRSGSSSLYRSAYRRGWVPWYRTRRRPCGLSSPMRWLSSPTIRTSRRRVSLRVSFRPPIHASEPAWRCRCGGRERVTWRGPAPKASLPRGLRHVNGKRPVRALARDVGRAKGTWLPARQRGRCGAPRCGRRASARCGARPPRRHPTA